MDEIDIYTDGACSGNPGPGGWGALLRAGPHEKELWGGEPATTNNRMELLAAISALNSLKEPCEIDLHTDSKYVMDGISSDEAVAVAGEIGARQTWLTHLTHLSDHATLEATLPSGICVSYDGLRRTL